MKTNDRWNQSYRGTFITKYFPPRIQNDLNQLDIPIPPNLKTDFGAGRGLFFFGPTGSGKTLIACELLLEEKKRLWMTGGEGLNKEFMFISAPELLMEIKKTFEKESDLSEEVLIQHYSSVYFLVLDDLGVIAKSSEWVLNTLYLIINKRYEQMLPTIYTSNLDLDGVADLFDDRIASRIQRSCKIIKKDHWTKGSG